MDSHDADIPTFARTIFVGGGSGSELIVRAILQIAERFLADDMPMAAAMHHGELSKWISDVKAHDANPKLFASQGVTASTERQLLEMLMSVITDSTSEAERALMKTVLDNIETADWHTLIGAASSTDDKALNQQRSRINERIAHALGAITAAQRAGLMDQLARFRAIRATCLCMVFYRTLPMALIDRARNGDRRAALDLIKIDKLFITDSCIGHILRDAALRGDRSFLRQFGRVVAAAPRVGSQKICRLYLYFLWSLGVELPSTARLQLLLDPDGLKFRSSGAFEKYLERCKAEFHKMSSANSS